MIDESLLKSNFIGRDGFRWWMGQIPPEPHNEQGNGGWGNRFKVRILGYHPLDDKTLKNEDLPWALVMLPTTAGTGGAGKAASVRISAGDIVFGFFMDGDDAQQPVIMGALGGTADWNRDASYSFPFQPFTGYTSKIPKPPASRSTANQTNEQNVTSNEPPIQTDEKKAASAGRASASPASQGTSLPTLKGHSWSLHPHRSDNEPTDKAGRSIHIHRHKTHRYAFVFFHSHASRKAWNARREANGSATVFVSNLSVPIRIAISCGISVISPSASRHASGSPCWS